MSELIAEIGRTGFLLETRTAVVFESENFDVKQNLLLEDVTGTHDRLIELDVFATSRTEIAPKDTYIVDV